MRAPCITIGTWRALLVLLDKDDTPRNILNSIRVKQFSDNCACFFIDNNQKYEVRVNIKKYEED